MLDQNLFFVPFVVHHLAAGGGQHNGFRLRTTITVAWMESQGESRNGTLHRRYYEYRFRLLFPLYRQFGMYVTTLSLAS